MIHVLLSGGLGNQLFQYATARALAIAHSTSVVLDVRSFPFDIYGRRFALAPFSLAANMVDGDPTASARLLAFPRMRAIAWRLTTHIWPQLRYSLVGDRTFAFDSRVLEAADGVCLRGDFQSERYFLAIREKLLEEFTPQQPAAGRNAELLDEITRCRAMCVHMRLGHHDGTVAHTNSRHGTTPTAYFDRAVAEIIRDRQPERVFVFADDPARARGLVRFPLPTVFVDHNSGDEAHEDLRLMAACRYFVIPNSSLSWWGAWLSTASDKMVVAPAQWFSGMTHDTRDLIPTSWLRR